MRPLVFREPFERDTSASDYRREGVRVDNKIICPAVEHPRSEAVTVAVHVARNQTCFCAAHVSNVAVVSKNIYVNHEWKNSHTRVDDDNICMNNYININIPGRLYLTMHVV